MSNVPDRMEDSNKKTSTPPGDDKKVAGAPPTQGKTDPQLTELDGLRKGGVEPTVNPEDKARDKDGKPD